MWASTCANTLKVSNYRCRISPLPARRDVQRQHPRGGPEHVWPAKAAGMVTAGSLAQMAQTARGVARAGEEYSCRTSP
jgi:hypothetical protein